MYIQYSADCIGFVPPSYRGYGKLGWRGHVPGAAIPGLKEVCAWMDSRIRERLPYDRKAYYRNTDPVDPICTLYGNPGA
jgi:hypothetical protein